MEAYLARARQPALQWPGYTTRAVPVDEREYKTAKAVEYVDVRRYVLGANIIEHVTNSNTVI